MSEYDSVAKQSDGYPKGITKEQKEQLESLVKKLLQKTDHMPLHRIYDCIKHQEPEALKKAVCLDWIYCAVDRAARAVADPVFKLKEERVNWLTKGQERLILDAQIEGGYKVKHCPREGYVLISKGKNYVTKGIILYENGTAVCADLDPSVAKIIRTQKEMREILFSL